MKPMNVKELRRVARQIVEKPELFDMKFYFNKSRCGTVCCIAGQAILNKYGSEFDCGVFHKLACDIFGITEEQSIPLFAAENWPSRYCNQYFKAKTHKSRALIAARRIRHFIKTGGRE